MSVCYRPEADSRKTVQYLRGPLIFFAPHEKTLAHLFYTAPIQKFGCRKYLKKFVKIGFRRRVLLFERPHILHLHPSGSRLPSFEALLKLALLQGHEGRCIQ